MADKAGVPQHELAARFTIEEWADIQAARRLRYRENDKDDYRLAMLIYYLVELNTTKDTLVDIERFLPSWDGKTPEQRRHERMTAQEIEDEIAAKFELAAQLHGWKRIDQ